MPDCLIFAVLLILIASFIFIFMLCLGLAGAAVFALIERRARVRYRSDVARVQATITCGTRITEHRIKLQ